jgi:hypothetical protein
MCSTTMPFRFGTSGAGLKGMWSSSLFRVSVFSRTRVGAALDHGVRLTGFGLRGLRGDYGDTPLNPRSVGSQPNKFIDSQRINLTRHG